MVIAICILSGLLLLSLLIIATMWSGIGKMIEMYIKEHPEESLKQWFEQNIEERYPCTLLLSVKEGADFTGSVYDFSLYDEKKIIGLTEYQTEIEHEDKNDEDGIRSALLPNQIVCKMKDGSYQWDFRPLM
jgi:hypothetical protein